MGIYRFTTFSTMARTAVSMRCSACCRMAVQVRSASLRRAASAACPASPARCSALGLGLLLQKLLLRRLQLVYFFTVQFTHRLS